MSLEKPKNPHLRIVPHLSEQEFSELLKLYNTLKHGSESENRDQKIKRLSKLINVLGQFYKNEKNEEEKNKIKNEMQSLELNLRQLLLS